MKDDILADENRTRIHIIKFVGLMAPYIPNHNNLYRSTIKFLNSIYNLFIRTLPIKFLDWHFINHIGSNKDIFKPKTF